ncbi:MAG: hypothetical protein ABSB35_40945 [Bryobacteraceae bacterium]|jgi:hypothetical protein
MLTRSLADHPHDIVSLCAHSKRLRAYEIEFGADRSRLGCNFLFDDGSLLFVHESQITSEIEALMASLGSPTEGLTRGGPRA